MRAREIPLPGNQGARPLRGPDALFGLPGLRPFKAEQVAAANAVYRACIRILFRAYQTGALISIENPVRSWLWPLLASLVKAFGHAAFAGFFALTDYDFDACVFGSRRAKATRMKGTPEAFEGLQLPCDQSHTHLSWKPVRVAGRRVYPTKEEAEYTPQLCAFLCKKASAASATKTASLPASKRAKLLRAEVRASAQHQHVSMPPLTPEFRCTTRCKDVPIHCDVKLLVPADSSNAGVKSDPSAPSAKQRIPVKPDDVVGVYYTIKEHLETAKDLPGPRLPDPLRKNLFLILTEGPVAVSKMRLQALREVNELAAKLAEEEKTLRSSMHPDVEAVTKGKSISVFQALLEETNFPDMSVVDLLVSGVPLVGEEQPSALFAKRHNPAALLPHQLETQCVLRREALRATRGKLDPSDSKDLQDEAASEVEAGFMTGPYHSEREVTANFTVGLLRFVSRSLQGNGRIEVPMLEGSSLVGDLCPEMKRRPALLGKTLDLSKAYRQVAIHPDSRKHAVLGFPDLKGSWQYYLACCLPFGASASVFGFNKIALAILHILVIKFLALATDFYDDYTLFEFQPGASLLDKICMRLLAILGWMLQRKVKSLCLSELP